MVGAATPALSACHHCSLARMLPALPPCCIVRCLCLHCAPERLFRTPSGVQRLDWERDHVMHLPPELSPGMVAWLADADAQGPATPACITAINGTMEAGVFSPFVRVSGGARGWVRPV